LLAVLLVCCLAVTVSAKNDVVNKFNAKNEFELRELFTQFKADHSKSYESAELEAYRYGVFVENLAKIDQWNEENGEVAFGINKFTDMTVPEFTRTHHGYIPKTGQAAIDRTKLPVYRNVRAPQNVTHVDWREKNAVSAVKDQGSCGSCWAFSATEGLESAWFLAGKGSLPVLSEQQTVDCDTVDAGCNGGDLPSAFDYMKKAGGVEAETSYPYTAKDGTCKFTASKVVAKLANYTYATPACFDSCNSQDETTLLNNLAVVGPSSICVNAADNWMTYTSGIIKASCTHSYSVLNHCVQLVGYNEDSTGKYWIVRNSWGTSWGVKGYIYIQFGSNLCGIADEATFVTV